MRTGAANAGVFAGDVVYGASIADPALHRVASGAGVQEAACTLFAWRPADADAAADAMHRRRRGD
jgi:hypothetical protein